MSPNPRRAMLSAPEHLGLDSRNTFREEAFRLLEDVPGGEGQLIIDLGATARVDSAGLGALMLIQRKAAERQRAVVLRNASDELRYLLMLTKLDDLFLLETHTGS